MNFEELDSAFFSSSSSSVSSEEKASSVSEYPDCTISVYDPKEDRWMSFEEWHWRMTDKIFDDDRKKRGLRIIKKDIRERSLQSYLSQVNQ